MDHEDGEEAPDAAPAGNPTRWESVPGGSAYGRHFADLLRAGTDVAGEARLADALLPRGATVLDAGSGMGRTGAALLARGHHACGVDLDADLLAQSRSTYPDLPVLEARLEELTPEALADAGLPTAFDLVVAVGNVLIYLAPGTERLVLSRLAALLRPGGRLLVGFETASAKPAARPYPTAEFLADAAAAGLRPQHLFGSFELAPVEEGSAETFLVAVLTRG